MLNTNQFANKIKQKYPQYGDIEDEELVDKILTKYPEYKDQVDITKEGTTPPPQDPEKFQGFRGAKFSELAEVAKGTPEGEEVERRLGQETKVGLAKAAPFAVPMARGLKIGSKVARAGYQAAQQAGVNLMSRFAEEEAKGEDIETSIQKAKESGVGAGAITLGLAGTGKGISYLANKLAPFTKKSVSAIQQGLTSIPKDRVEYAVNEELAGRSIFKGSFDPTRTFHSIGKRVQKAINYLVKKEGEIVGLEANKLKGSPIKLNTKEIRSGIKNRLGKSGFDTLSTLPDNEIKTINSIKKLLQPKDWVTTSGFIDRNKDHFINIGKLHAIKRKINNILPANAFSNQTVKVSSKEGVGVLKKMAAEIDSVISEAVPEYKKVNLNYSKVAKLKESLRNKLKDENVEKNIRNIYNKDIFTQGLFQELDELAPKGMKFQEKLHRAIVRNDYEQIAPGRGGGSGGGQGLLNLIRGGIVGGSVMSGSVPGALAIGAAVSPSIGGKATVKALGAVPRIGRGLGRYSQPAIPLGSRYVGEDLIGNER